LAIFIHLVLIEQVWVKQFLLSVGLFKLYSFCFSISRNRVNILVVGVDLWCGAVFFILLFDIFFKMNGIFCYLGLDAEKRGLI
jgi:hypothetical protein